MAGLLDGLQGGGSYPAVAPTGRNLWDLLSSAISSDPSNYAAADAAAQAEAARYAAAQQQADSNAAAALTPVAVKPANGTGRPIYAMGTQDPTAPLQLPGSGAPMGFGGPGGQDGTAGLLPVAPTNSQPPIIAPQAAPVAAPQAPAPTVATNPTANPIMSATGGAPAMAPGVILNDDGSDPNAAPDPATATTLAATQLQGAVQSPEDSKSLLQGFADQAKGIADKLTNLSPNASQALIATGLATLAANDGSRNLGQVVGIGGAAGLNNYQTNVQNQAKNQLAATKLAQDQYLNIRKQNLEENKFFNTPTVVKPGESVITPGNRTPQQIGGAAVARTMKFQDSDGNEYEQGFDYANNPVGQPVPTKIVGSGEPTGEQAKAIADQINTAQEAKTTLGKTQDYLQKLSPTMVDPATGKTVPNPNYVDVKGGLAGDVQGLWTRITGDTTEGQQLAKQIANTTTLGQLSQYKAGIGGRLTNTDVGILQKGIPVDNMSGETIRNFLTTYGKYQEAIAEREAAKSAYLQQNRGYEPLRHDLTVGGVTYPKGTTFDDFLADKGGHPAGQGTSAAGGGAQGNGNINANVLAGAKAAARAGDANAQAALKRYGVSW